MKGLLRTELKGKQYVCVGVCQADGVGGKEQGQGGGGRGGSWQGDRAPHLPMLHFLFCGFHRCALTPSTRLQEAVICCFFHRPFVPQTTVNLVSLLW